jgi:hypothetical protein
MKANLPCPTCGPEVQHVIDGDDAACLSCGLVHSVELDLLEGVVEVAFCLTCRETLAVGHACIGDAPACESQTHLIDRCGKCRSCLLVQKAFIAAQAGRRAEYEHGTPSDLYPA